MRVGDVLDLLEQGNPATPAIGRALLYVKGDGRIYAKTAAGVEVDVGSWSNLSGKPSTFPPDTHAHSVNDLTATGTPASNSYLRGDGQWFILSNPSQAEAEAGTATSLRLWTAQRVNQAIQALAPVKSNDSRLSDARPPRKFAQTIGDGAALSYTVTHGFGTRDVSVSIYDATTYADVQTDVVRSTVDAVQVSFAAAPALNAYRVVVIG